MQLVRYGFPSSPYKTQRRRLPNSLGLRSRTLLNAWDIAGGPTFPHNHRKSTSPAGQLANP